MNYSVCVRTSKIDGKFLDFVVANKTSKYVKRVSTKEVTTMMNAAKKSDADLMASSLRVAMLALDSQYRKGSTLAKDWKYVARKIYGCARIG